MVNRNPCNGYINHYYWLDDHPLLYGNNGSLDPGTVVKHIWSAKKAFRRSQVTKQDKSIPCFSIHIWAWPKECFHPHVNDKTQFTVKPHNQRFNTKNDHGTTYLLLIPTCLMLHARCNCTPCNLFTVYLGTSDDTPRGMKLFLLKMLVSIRCNMIKPVQHQPQQIWSFSWSAYMLRQAKLHRTQHHGTIWVASIKSHLKMWSLGKL